jgi:hypothetical protein
MEVDEKNSCINPQKLEAKSEATQNGMLLDNLNRGLHSFFCYRPAKRTNYFKLMLMLLAILHTY